MISDIGAVRLNRVRTEEHDSLLSAMEEFIAELRIKGKDISWYELLDTRRKIGDFACFILYTKAMEAR